MSQLIAKLRRIWTITDSSVAWAKPHLNIRNAKISLRCALGALVALILHLCGPTRRAIGGGCYLMLLLHYLIPPADPTALYLEKTIYAAVFMGLTWAADCFVIWIAWLARDDRWSKARFDEEISGLEGLSVQEFIYSGVHLETGSGVVTLFGGSVILAFIIWVRSRHATSAHAVTSIDCFFQAALPLTTSIFYPYPYYNSGLFVFLPFIIQQAVNCALTLLVFPENLHHRFLDLLIGTITPLTRIVNDQKEMLKTDPTSPEWRRFSRLQRDHSAITSAIFGLSRTQHLLGSEIAFCKLNSRDTYQILQSIRQFGLTSAGFVKFHSLIDRHITQSDMHHEVPDLDSFNIAMGRPDMEKQQAIHVPREAFGSPIGSPLQTLTEDERPQVRSVRDLFSSDQTPTSEQSTPRANAHGALPANSKRNSQKRQTTTEPVGLYMSSRYAQLENLVSNPNDVPNMKELVHLLHESSVGLLDAITQAFGHITNGLEKLKSTSLLKQMRGISDISPEMYQAGQESARLLQTALDDYETNLRLDIVQPFAPLFDPSAPLDARVQAPSHRCLFWSFLYQHSLSEFAAQVHKFLIQTLSLELERNKRRFWFPSPQLLLYPHPVVSDSVADVNPDDIQGLDASISYRAARDPDALPPQNLIQQAFDLLYKGLSLFVTPSALFVFKTAILEALLLFPAALKSFGPTYYRTRAVWAVVFASMTLTQYLGDTASGLFWRLIGVFSGCVCGLAVWEISRGNPYGLAVATFVVLLPLSFLRNHHPQAPLSIVTLTTFSLVIGYSWSNTVEPTIVMVGRGWHLTWVRFVLSTIGLVASYVWALIPPRATQKQVVRKTYARTLQEMGHIFCDTISYANTKRDGVQPPKRLLDNIYAVRGKLRASESQMRFIDYELGFRGTWPKAHYRQLFELQTELNSWLALLVDVTAELPQLWTQAFLTRTRLNDPTFVGRIMFCFHNLSTTLRLGLPGPALYTPLMEDFTSFTKYRYEISLEPHPELPKHVCVPTSWLATLSEKNRDVATLKTREYQRFSVAVTTVYAIINRLDKCTFLVKQLCGESYNCILRPEETQEKVKEM